jgi:FkbM family methyltransferase
MTYVHLLLKSQALLARYLPENVIARIPGASRVRTGVRQFVRSHVFPRGMKWVQVQDGFAKGLWIEIDLTTERTWSLGRHEPAIQKALRQLVAPGTVMYDVGAHIGFHALPAARAGAQVIAFEPDPESASRLRANVECNDLCDRVRVVQAAAWSEASVSLPFRRGLPRSQGGICWEQCQPVLASGEITAIRAVRLDDVTANDWPAPDIIKIDVEGAESEVLKGATGILQRNRPALIVEVHTASQHVLVSQLLSSLCYTTVWDTPPEGFPRTCFAEPNSSHSSCRS